MFRPFELWDRVIHFAGASRRRRRHRAEQRRRLARRRLRLEPLEERAMLATVDAGSSTDAYESGQGAGYFSLSRDDSQGALTVYYTLSGTAIEGTDYDAPTGSVTFPDGDYNADVLIVPVDDSVYETEETVTLTITPNAGYSIGTASTALSIFDEEDIPLLFVDYAGPVAEGNVVNFTVRVTGQWTTGTPVTVDYSTADLAADAGLDYQATSGTLTFNSAGSQTVAVQTYQDWIDDDGEDFQLELSNAAGAYIYWPYDSANIDDAAPTLLGNPFCSCFDVQAGIVSITHILPDGTALVYSNRDNARPVLVAEIQFPYSATVPDEMQVEGASTTSPDPPTGTIPPPSRPAT